jgi:putative transposase
VTEYRRVYEPGATWFFTVNLAQREGNRILIDHIGRLRDAFRYVRKRHDFRIDAVVILPDHLHCVWTLPDGDSDYSVRWNLLKGCFSRSISVGESISESRRKRRERGIWQRRFWEHWVRDENDLRRHIDYIHWNPVKHGHVERVIDWPFSSFHRYVRMGVYPCDWGQLKPDDVEAKEFD